VVLHTQDLGICTRLEPGETPCNPDHVIFVHSSMMDSANVTRADLYTDFNEAFPTLDNFLATVVNAPFVDGEGCIDLLKEAVCRFWIAQPCDAECTPLKACPRLCGEVDVRCRGMDGIGQSK